MIFGKHINKYYLKYAPILILGILSLVLVDYFQLKVPEFYRNVINGINDGYFREGDADLIFNIENLLEYICKPLIVVIIVMVIGRFLWRVCFYGSAIKVETDMRGEMFEHCLGLSHRYYQKNKVGNLMSLFTNDLETINECFGDGVMMLADALLLGILALWKMAKMDFGMTMLSMIPLAVLLVIGVIVGKSLQKKWELRQQAFSDLSDFSQESFSGIAVIKAFVKETAELMAFKKLNRKNEVTNVDFTKASTMLHILVTFFVESVVCVILGYGGYLVKIGIFNAGQLIEFIGYFNTIVWPVMAVSMLIEMSSRGKASLKRISELLDEKSELVDAPDVQDVDSLHGEIEFRNLSFTYPDGDFEAIENASFKIEVGENVGIVGKTGSGKTTIVDLLLRTYNVPDGTLFFDGHDVNKIPIKTVRSHCAYVPQDNFLFSDTIENNISFATDGMSYEDVISAAKLADIHDNVMEFSSGYKTILGERGVTVSGGQKQRISIARALMKNAPILILDDSVSAVDVKTEKVILENLANTRKGKTTILIAHRISTVEYMDKIIYIDDGKVIDVGRHDELYKRCEAYRTAVELQRLDRNSEGGAI